MTHKTATAVEADTGTTGCAVGEQASCVGPEVIGRVFGGDATLQSEAPQHDRLLVQTQISERLARCDPQLCFDEVNIGHFFGDGVLDLDTRVHLDEHVATGLVDQELDGARVYIVDVMSERDRIAGQCVSLCCRQVGGRSNLDDLLETPLDRTVALVEMNDVASRIAENLDFDVADVGHCLFEEDGVVAKGAQRFTHGGVDGLGQVGRVLDATHAAAAATCGCLDE